MAAACHEDNSKIGKELFTTIPEHPDPIEIKVKGNIPLWLRGSLIRVGPGKFEWNESNYKHWFDGQSILHCFNINNGKVNYRSQYLRSKSYTRSEKYGRVAMASFGTWAPPDPCKNIFARMFSYFFPAELSDNANVNVVDFKGAAFATTETPYFYHVDPRSGETLEEINVEDRLWGMRSWLPHPHCDKKGNAYNLSVSYLLSKYQILQIPPKSSEDNIWTGSKVVVDMPYSGTPSYFHSFGMTENYFILIENPLLMSGYLKLLLMNFLQYSYLDLLKWHKDKPSIIHVISRHSGKNVKTFTVETFFAFHHANAYETGNDIVVDVCGYPDTSVISAFYLRNLREGFENVSFTLPALRRYRLPLADKTEPSKEKSTAKLPKAENGYDFSILLEGLEMPQINYKLCNGKKYSYLYGVVFNNHNFFNTTLTKLNVDTGEVWKWSEEHALPSEPKFLHTPGSQEEDDGIILSVVSGVLGKKSFLLVLDAKTFKEIARAEINHMVNLTFHGSFWN